MCELFGVSSADKVKLNSMLKEFFSHGKDHPNGWGMAFFYGNAVSLEKQPENSCKSLYLKQRLLSDITADQMIAHIRLATKGGMEYDNTHPFVSRDNCGRTWTLAHNGTIFECEALNPFVYVQHGQTDSERILMYLISRVNERQTGLGRSLTQDERFNLVDEIICEITPENKVNLLLYDGELLYAHTNYQDSLHLCKRDKTVILSTVPLGKDSWDAMPVCRLMAYQNGALAHSGTDHGHEFFDSEEKTRMLFLDYSGL